ncbi:MAG: hypothetical protein ACXWHZ_05485 [Usitatibacter sp.]
MKTGPAPAARGLSAASQLWGARLQRAAATAELVRVAQSFLAACDASKTEILSRAGARLDCGSGDDLREVLVRLSVERAIAAAEVPEPLKQLFDFFTEAVSRFAQLEFELRYAAPR